MTTTVRTKFVFSFQFCLLTIVSSMSLWLGPQKSTSADVLVQPVGLTFHSDDRAVSFTSKFPGGRMNQCVQIGDQDFAVTIKPEADPINDSAWYAFQVKADKPQVISVRLQYVGGSHRYGPKISRDGKNWESAEHLVKHEHPMGSEVRLKVPVDNKPLWIAGQELLSDDDVSCWASKLNRRPHVTRKVIGESTEGRELYRLDITEACDPDYVFIIARQHPPEVSGAIGMMHFVDTLTKNTPLAQEFRSRYAAAVVPTVNPDGVAHGHWRCNANGVDLNRDWSHFTQPETKAVADEILKCRRAKDQELCLFIDFHSTFNDVFYTPAPTTKMYPKGFKDNWLEAIQKRFSNYEVIDDDSHNEHRSTSKAWVSEVLGVTAITYEFGDETDRDVIRRIASGAAEEMMKLLIELPDSSPAVAVAKNPTAVESKTSLRR